MSLWMFLDGSIINAFLVAPASFLLFLARPLKIGTYHYNSLEKERIEINKELNGIEEIPSFKEFVEEQYNK